MEINKLYNLVASNNPPHSIILNNIEIWQSFYKNRKQIIKENINNYKLYFIIKFLIKYEKAEIFECFPSVIRSALLKEEERLRTNLSSPINSKKIKILLNNLDFHNELSSFLNTIDLSYDHFAKFEVINYQADTFKILENLIETLYEHFFNLAPEIVDTIINSIENENILLKLKDEKILFHQEKNNFDFLNVYLNKLIPMMRYTGKNIKDSIIITKILDGTFNEKRIIYKFIYNINEFDLKIIINSNFKRFINFLNNQSTIDKQEKSSILYQVAKMFLNEEDFMILLNYYIKHNGQYLKELINETEIIKYIKKVSPAELSIETLNYLLEKNYASEFFIYNLKELINSKQTKFQESEIANLKNKLDQYEIHSNKNTTNAKNEILGGEKQIILEEIINSMTSSANKEQEPTDNFKYSFEECIKLVNEHLNSKINLTEKQTKEIIKIITKELNRYMNLNDIAVYFIESDKYNGEFFKETKIEGINLNIQLIKDFLNPYFPLERRSKIFITILHEIRHHEQYDKNSEINIDKYQMLKEKYLKKYDKNYYKNNYQKVSEEIDARVESYNMISKFFETFLPNHLSEVQDSIIESLTEELDFKKKQNETKKVEVIRKTDIDFNLAFDTLIRYNKSILKKESIFNLEYYESGLPKTVEELLISRNEQNYKIIDEILRTRYLYNITEDLNSKHTK